MELLEYNYKVPHWKGAQHHAPDALSRIPEQIKEFAGEESVEPKEVGASTTVAQTTNTDK